MKATGLALLALFAASGCSDIFGGRQPSSFKASLSFSEGDTASYRGEGDFYEGPNSADRVEMRFDLGSQSGAGGTWQSFNIHRRGAGIPSAGTYALTPLDMSNPKASGVTVLYFRQNGGVREYYRSLTGELHVTAASNRRVEGTFRFTGFLYCAYFPDGRQEGICKPVGGPTAGAPTIEVQGTFSAVPFDDSDIEEMAGTETIPR